MEIAQAGADLTDKEIHFIDFAMSRDEEKRRQAHRRAAEAVRALLDRGTDVAMPVLGDVSLFASSAYVAQLLEEEGLPLCPGPGGPQLLRRRGPAGPEPDGDGPAGPHRPRRGASPWRRPWTCRGQRC